MGLEAISYNLGQGQESSGSWIEDLDHLKPRTKSRIVSQGLLALGESYLKSEWDVPHLDRFLYKVFSEPAPKKALLRQLPLLLQLLREKLTNPQRGLGAFRIGREHYDLGNELFEAMLDGSMTYTCGYWEKSETLEQAQKAKLDLVCRKLALKPGMKVLDIGCGWGNFAQYAAKQYGAHVTGLTVSNEQAQYAREACRDLPVEIRVQDYRLVNEQFDHVVSLEMIEAVGRQNLRTFYQTVERCLKSEGLFVLQAISTETLSKFSDLRVDQFLLWILKYIFPDGYLPKVSELLEPARDKLVIEDWHNFGADYDRTLCAWAENFNRSWDKLSNRYDERFKRRWNFYLNACAALFRARKVHLYQIVYSKAEAKQGYRSVR